MNKSVTANESSLPRLFISYGRRDATDLVDRLQTDLEGLGFEIWRDSSKIRAGQAWEYQIRDGLHSTQIMIAVLSPHAVRLASEPGNPDQQDGVCLDEISFARFSSPSKPIVPVMAIPCESPFSIFRLDYVDLTRWKDSEDEYRKGLDRLLQGISSTMKGEPRYRSWDCQLQPWDFAAFLYEKRRDFTGRNWLFQEIESWRRRNSNEAALLIVGDPGTGKSAIVAELVHRNSGGQVLAYHCCQWDTPDTVATWRFVRSIAAMIATRIPEYASLLTGKVLQEHLSEDNCRRDPASAFEAGVLSPLECVPAPENGPRYLLLDALDEALTAGTNNIVRLLATRLNRFPGWLRIVATSRKDPDVLTRLRGLRAKEIRAHDDQNLADVRHYISLKLHEPELRSLAGTPSSLADGIKTLTELSDGNFRYARMAVEGLQTAQFSFDALHTLPPGLYGLYLQAFERMFPLPSDFAISRRVLAVVLTAQRPLSTLEIALATRLDERTELWPLLRLMQNFIPPGRSDCGQTYYQLFHKSLADWLTSDDLLGSEFSISVVEGHELLAAWATSDDGTSSEHPYIRSHGLTHLLATRQWDVVGEWLTNILYLEARVVAGELFALIADFQRVVHSIPPQHPAKQALELLVEAIRRDAHFIARHFKDYPQAIFQCLWNNAWWHDCDRAAAHYESGNPQLAEQDSTCIRMSGLLERMYRERHAAFGDFDWVQSLRPPQIPLQTALNSVLSGHQHGIKSLAWSVDGRIIASGSGDQTIRLWNSDTGQELIRMTGHMGNVEGVAIHPSTDCVASVSLDGTVRLWGLTTGHETLRATLPGVQFTDVKWCLSGTRLVTVSSDGFMRVWTDDLKVEKELQLEDGWLWSLSVSESRMQAVTGGDRGAVFVVDLATGSLAFELTGHEGPVWGVDVTKCGGRIGSASSDKTVRIWSADERKELHCIRGHQQFARAVSFSYDGSRLASVSYDKWAKVWNTTTGRLSTSFPRHEQRVRCVACSPVDDRVATGGRDIRLMSGGAVLHNKVLIDHHRRWVDCVVLSSDGALAASASGGGSVRLWATALGLQVLRIPVSDAWVSELKFSDDGRHLRLVLSDGNRRVIDIDTGELVSGSNGIHFSNESNFEEQLLATAVEIGEVEFVREGIARAWWPKRLDRIATGLECVVGSSANHVFILSLVGSSEQLSEPRRPR